MLFITAVIFVLIQEVISINCLFKNNIDDFYDKLEMETYLRPNNNTNILRDGEKEDSFSNNDLKIIYRNGVRYYLEENKKKDYQLLLRDLLQMKDYDCVYKRGSGPWTTWKMIKDKNGGHRLISYKCRLNNINNYQECKGNWRIEQEEQECGYEISSILKNGSICVQNHTNFSSNKRSCESIIDEIDLSGRCDNPIRTRWRLTKKFVDSSNVKNEPICKGDYYCELNTVYYITETGITYKIIKNGKVIFSKIMKKGANYLCSKKCGE